MGCEFFSMTSSRRSPGSRRQIPEECTPRKDDGDEQNHAPKSLESDDDEGVRPVVRHDLLLEHIPQGRHETTAHEEQDAYGRVFRAGLEDGSKAQSEDARLQPWRR